MTTNYVQVNADSTGKKVRTNEITDANGNTVEQQYVELADNVGGEVVVPSGTDTTSQAVQGIVPQALVNDAPSSYITNQLQPLSLTNDGRLRVSQSPPTVDFFEDEQRSCWGEGPSMTPSNPW